MFQAHGWVEILTTVDGEEDYTELTHIADDLAALIGTQQLSCAVEVRGIGGSVILCVHLVQNRARGVDTWLRSILEWIGENARGSYGLIYIRDDDTLGNRFAVVSLKRGKVRSVPDRLLSPIAPELEEP